jgi:hypothetical protein
MNSTSNIPFAFPATPPRVTKSVMPPPLMRTNSVVPADYSNEPIMPSPLMRTNSVVPTDDYTEPIMQLTRPMLMRTNSVVPADDYTEPIIQPSVPVTLNRSLPRPMLVRTDSVTPQPLVRTESTVVHSAVTPQPLVRTESTVVQSAVTPQPLVRTESTVVQSAFSFADQEDWSKCDHKLTMHLHVHEDQCTICGLQVLLQSVCIHNNTEFQRGTYSAGTMRFADDSAYYGEWDNDAFNGHGILITGKDSRFEGRTYNGSWYKNDKMEFRGSGTITFTDGSVYEGEWADLN